MPETHKQEQAVPVDLLAEAQAVSDIEQQAQVDESRSWRDAVVDRIAGFGESISSVQHTVREKIGQLGIDRARQAAVRVGRSIISTSPNELITSTWLGTKDAGDSLVDKAHPHTEGLRDYIRLSASMARSRVEQRKASRSTAQNSPEESLPVSKSRKDRRDEEKRALKEEAAESAKMTDADVANILLDRYLKYKGINDAHKLEKKEQRQERYEKAKFIGKTVLESSKIVVSEQTNKVKRAVVQKTKETSEELKFKVWKIRLSHELNQIEKDRRRTKLEEDEDERVNV